MAWQEDQRLRTGVAAEAIDEGLRRHMIRVYNFMTGGLALTGLIAYVIAHTPAFFNAIFGTPLMWVVMLAPLGFVFALSFGIQRFQYSTAQILFWSFAAIMGMSIASIFVLYTGESIARVFFISAGTFAAMSLYGYTTKRDLTRLGSFLFMGLIGIILASLVNMFVQSTMLHFVVSVIGVLIFVGLTAHDTQRIKWMYNEADAGEVAGKKALMGALSLYLDFINLFLLLLRLFGERR